MTEDNKPILGEVLKDLEKATNPEKRAELIGLACLEVAGMESIARAIWIKVIAKQSKLSKEIIGKKVREKEKILNDKRPIPTGEIDELFKQPDLLALILQDIDADHKLDEYERAALFLIRLTGELPNPKDRRSAALKGDSSTGKDNLVAAILKKFPSEDNELLTHTTAAALRKSLDEKRCFAFSEINAHREGGANKDIVETFKQLAEGGINAKMCDKQTGELIELKSEQKTLIYGTTDVETDDELHTRYIVIPLHSDQEKNQTVVHSVLDKAAKPKDDYNDSENWCSRSIRLLDHELDVIIPFSDLLKEKVEGKPLFDYTKPRIMRDVKRLISLTKAVTWLYQQQRAKKEYEGKNYLIAEPTDFLTAYDITARFFNLTYSGLDHRLEACYKKILELQGKHDDEIIAFGHGAEYFGWVLRHKLAEELGIQSVNTIKQRINKLKDFQLVTTHYTYDKPQAYIVKGVKQGISRLSMGVTLTALTPYLHPPDILTLYKESYGVEELKPVIWRFSSEEEKAQGRVGRKLTPVKLTPSIFRNTHTPIVSEVSEEVVK